jgi:hypothetical protein
MMMRMVRMERQGMLMIQGKVVVFLWKLLISQELGEHKRKMYLKLQTYRHLEFLFPLDPHKLPSHQIECWPRTDGVGPHLLKHHLLYHQPGLEFRQNDLKCPLLKAILV